MKFADLAKEDDKLRPYRVGSEPIRIVVIGCGGTGGYVIPDLLRAVKFAYHIDRQPLITLIDGDQIEKKNISRQNFIEKDLGSYKAEIMAKRYGQAFGLEISYINSYLEDKAKLIDILKTDSDGTSGTNLIISCVDSLAARKLIFESLHSSEYNGREYNHWIDSGNEDTFGQVVFSTPYNYNNQDDRLMRIRNLRSNWEWHARLLPIPSLAELFPQILESTKSAKPVINCAVIAEETPQNILINRVAATIVLGYAYKVIYNQELLSFMTTFDIHKGFHQESITYKNLLKVWKKAYPQDIKIQNM